MNSKLAVKMTARAHVGRRVERLALSKVRSGMNGTTIKLLSSIVTNGPCRRHLVLATLLAINLVLPVFATSQATPRGIFSFGVSVPPYGDSAFCPPCDSAARSVNIGRFLGPRGASETGGTPPLNLAATMPSNWMPSIWDGAQLELVTTDPNGVSNPMPPGRAFAMDSRGRSYLLYARAYGNPSLHTLQFRYMDPGGSWGTEVPLPLPPQEFVHAGVMVSPKDDNPDFFFLDGGNFEPSFIVHGRYDFTGGTWTLDTVAQTINQYWHEGKTFSFGADTSGGLHVAWTDPGWNEALQASVDQIWYANNTTGAWRKQRITDRGTGGAITVEPSGHVYVVYMVRPGTHTYSVVAQNRFRGDTTWASDSTDSYPAAYVAQRLVIGRDGTQHTCFYGPGCLNGCWNHYLLFYANRPAGSKVWGNWQFISDSSAGAFLAVYSWGKIHLLHGKYMQEWYDLRILYATNTSGTWSNREMSFGPMASWEPAAIDFFLDWYDQAHVVITADHNSDLVFELYYFASPWVTLDVLDVVRVIDAVFGAGDAMADPLRYDLNCDGHVDAADVWRVISYAFMDGPKGCRF